MPDKPGWCANLPRIIEELRALPFSDIDRATVEAVLGVGRRRAQQILAPCTNRQIGSSGVAEKEALIAHLEQMAGGEAAYYERRRRKRLARELERLNQSWLRNPKVLVEAPVDIVNQQLERLPEGISVRPGEIAIRFGTMVQALERLLALGMAISNNVDGFERMVSGSGPVAESPGSDKGDREC